MTLTIDLTPEQEGRLVAVARSRGLDPVELAMRLVTEHLPQAPESGGNGIAANAPLPAGVDKNHFYFTATPQEWEAAMDELAAGGEAIPVLPDEAYDRENLYEDRL